MIKELSKSAKEQLDTMDFAFQGKAKGTAYERGFEKVQKPIYEWVLGEIEKGEPVEKVLLAVMTITTNTVLTLVAQPDVPSEVTEHYVQRCADAMVKFAKDALAKNELFIKGTVAITPAQGRA